MQTPSPAAKPQQDRKAKTFDELLTALQFMRGEQPRPISVTVSLAFAGDYPTLYPNAAPDTRVGMRTVIELLTPNAYSEGQPATTAVASITTVERQS